MTARTDEADAAATRPADRAGRACQWLAILLLLLCVTGRPFLGEVPFRTSQLRAVPGPDESGQSPVLIADRGELARVGFSLVILAAWCAYLAGSALQGRLRLRLPLIGALILVFTVLSLLSALQAGDKRSALDSWLEQACLLAACYLAAQAFQRPRAFGLLVIVLAAVGVTLAAKGLVQAFVEVPQRVADFEEHRAQRLAEMAIQPGSEQERLFEGRLRDPAPFGFLPLANPFATMLLVMTMAAGGLAADKWRRALADRKLASRSKQVRLKPGDVHLPTVAAVVQTLAVPAMATVLLLARSLGASISFAAAAAAAAGIYVWRDTLARHWRKALAVAAGLFVLGLAATIAYGLATNHLPSKTMTFRWHYWTGGMRVLAERPWLGTGPANFATAYLRDRPIQGEESVKDPHNVIVHALVQHGIPGGACYLAVLVLVLIGMARPVDSAADPRGTGVPPVRPTGILPVGQGRDGPATHGRDAHATGEAARTPLPLMVALVLAVPAVRILFADSASNGVLLAYDAIAPAVVLAIALVACLWAGGPLRQGSAGKRGQEPFLVLHGDIRVQHEKVPDPFFPRIALACGVAGFALHALAEISLYMPASATVFWLAAGGALAVAGTAREVDLSRLRWPAAGVMMVATVGLALWLAPPVTARLALTQQMLDGMVARPAPRGESDAAAQFAQQAAQADGLDPLAANDAARMTLSTCPRVGPGLSACLDQARRWAQEAARRDPTDFANFAILGDIAWFQAYPDCFTYWPLHARADDKGQPPPAAASSPPALADRAERFLRDHPPGADAADLLERAAALDPFSPCLLERLGDAYAQAGAADKARAAWRKATALFTAAANQSGALGPGFLSVLSKEALEFTARAVELNPHDLRLRLDYARRLASVGRHDDCLRQLDHAEKVDASYYPESVLRLGPSERQTVRLLRARCPAG